MKSLSVRQMGDSSSSEFGSSVVIHRSYPGATDSTKTSGDSSVVVHELEGLDEEILVYILSFLPTGSDLFPLLVVNSTLRRHVRHLHLTRSRVCARQILGYFPF